MLGAPHDSVGISQCKESITVEARSLHANLGRLAAALEQIQSSLTDVTGSPEAEASKRSIDRFSVLRREVEEAKAHVGVVCESLSWTSPPFLLDREFLSLRFPAASE